MIQYSFRKQRLNILIIGNLFANPSSKAFLKKFTNLMTEIGEDVFVVSADKPSSYINLEWIELNLNHKKNIFDRLFSFIYSQLRLAYVLVSNSKRYNCSIVLATSFFIPIIFLRLYNKKVILYVDGKPNSDLLTFCCHIGFILSNVLAVESTNIISDWNIHKYKKKIELCPQYVDEHTFQNKNDIRYRNNIVGYIGGLTKWKGLKEFLQAISILNSEKRKIEYVICGTGDCEELVETYCDKYSNIKFKGLVPHSEIAETLNEFKLLVLPSFSEGMPNIILEAMSCGTPVLATSVGGIPDIIIDGQTGFIIENNSPECIARGIIRALNHANLEKVTNNALVLINQNYRFKDCVKRYSSIFDKLN